MENGIVYSQIKKMEKVIYDKFNAHYYVDSSNGNDKNVGNAIYPLKSIKKAVDKIPAGGTGLIELKSDINLDNETDNINFENKRLLIRCNGYNIISSANKKFVCNNFFGYIKIYAGNGKTSYIDATNGKLITFTDTIGSVVIGDYDSTLNIDIKGNLISIFRSQIIGYSIRTNYTGKSDESTQDYIVYRDADQVKFHTHATCSLSQVVVSSGVRDPYVLRDENKVQTTVTLYVDPDNGSDKNPGQNTSFPLKTLSKALNKIPIDKIGIIKLLNDVTINNYTDISKKTIYIVSNDTNVDNAAKLTIKITDNDTTTIGGSPAFLAIKTHVTFDGNGTKNPSCVWIPRGQFALMSNLRDSDGKIAQMNVDVNSPVKIGGGNNVIWYECNFRNLDDDTLIYAVPRTGSLKVLNNVTVDGSAITADDIKNHSTGIQYDSDSGNPINVMCNINLSN